MAQNMTSLLAAQISKFYQQLRPMRHHMCNYTKELNRHVVHPATPSASSPDLLLNNLRNASSTKSVLEMVSMHNKIMNNKHIMQALRSLFTLQKSGDTQFSTREMMRHPDFKKLCQQLRYQAPAIELNETIEALKVVSYVGVPADSTIVQVLLQLLRHNINLLSLQQIIFLDFLLSQFKLSPLVEALQLALPIVFDIQLPTKINGHNAAVLAEYLYFASRHTLSGNSLEMIVERLMMPSLELDVKTAKSVVWSICEIDHQDAFRPLMKKAIDTLMVHLDELSYTEMETTLFKLACRYSKKSDYFYNEAFFDSCANYVIDKDLGFKHSIYILKKLARLGHCNNFLLDYMAMQVQKDPQVFTEADLVDIYTIVVSVALTEYRPVHWDMLKELIWKYPNMTEGRDILWMKFASSLCLLDIYRLEVLTKCLNESFLQNLFKKRYVSDFENFATIWQCISLYKPELSGLLPARFAPEFLVKKYRPLTYPLESAVLKAFGGETYVKTGLFSKMGLQIDHVVALRKGGYSVAMNSVDGVEFIEDLDVSSDNQIVVILGLGHYQYTMNKQRLKFSTIVAMKSLESKGYHVVPICLETWESLADFEKIPYIMQQIKEKVDSDLKVSENVI